MTRTNKRHRAAFRRYLRQLDEVQLVRCRQNIGNIPPTSANHVDECLADIATEFKARDRATDRAERFVENGQ